MMRHDRCLVNNSPDESRPDISNDEFLAVAGIIQGNAETVRVFLSDEAAPPIDKAALADLWARRPQSEAEKQRLIYLVSHYRTWLKAMTEVVYETNRERRGLSTDES